MRRYTDRRRYRERQPASSRKRSRCWCRSRVGADDADKLLTAGGDATAAEDALLVVSDKMGGGIVDLGGSHRAFKLVLVHAVVVAELLKLAVAASDAGETLLVVVGEKKLKGGLSAVADGRGIGEYLHALVDRIDAGGDQ